MINGADANEGVNNGTAIIPNLDSIDQFRIITNNFDAEYGNFSGGQVNVVTKSGTNSFHGDVFNFLRNTDLDAKNYFDQGSIPPFRRNQFGGALGGPLKKNKLFLFGNYEGFRQSLALSSVSVVPDAQVRLGFLPRVTIRHTSSHEIGVAGRRPNTPAE